MCRAEKRFVFQVEHAAALKYIFAGEMVKLGGAHGSLKFGDADHLTKEMIGLEQDIILKENVVNANDSLFTQDPIVQAMQSPPHLEANAEMCIVVKICSR